MTDPLKVVFIAGWGRSGSTLLDLLLGQSPGFFSAGEVRFIWDRGLLQDRPCGCSAAFRSCPVWSKAATRWLEAPQAEIERIVGLRDAFKSRQCWQALTRGGRARLASRLGKYLPHLRTLYSELASTTGARVVVDSSKFPSHGYALGLLESLDLHVVHLVRDPRAVAFSWQRKKIYDTSENGPQYIAPHGVFGSSVYWLIWNATIEYLWNRPQNRSRYCRVLYEDLVRDPAETLQRIHALLDEPMDSAFLRADGVAELQPSHLISGNPARFHDGTIRLELDEEWRSSMRGPAKLNSSLISLPLLARYGYLANRGESTFA